LFGFGIKQRTVFQNSAKPLTDGAEWMKKNECFNVSFTFSDYYWRCVLHRMGFTKDG
jgi:hypothetical protein